MLSTVDADEVSPVFRAANRRRVVLKGDDDMSDSTDEQIRDILSVPWEHEGAMVDSLRASGADEVVQKSMISAVRLLQGVSGELPESIVETVEKLGTELYAHGNPKLNSQIGRGNGGELFDTESNDDDLEGSGSGPDKDGSAHDGELIGHGKPAPKVAADDPDDDMDDDGVMKDDAPYGNVTYADTGFQKDGKKRYPLNSELRIRAAWSYINQEKNAAKYSSANLATVKGRISAAMKRLGATVAKADAELEQELRDAGVIIPDGMFARIKKAFTKTQDNRSNTPDDPGSATEPAEEPGNDNTVEKGGTVETSTIQVPIRKEDGSGWDYSGVPEAARPYFQETIEKAERTAAELETVKGQLATETDVNVTREIVAKADEVRFVAAPTDLVPILKEAKAKMDPESFTALENILRAANERVEKSALFTEMGARNGETVDSAGDAWSKIEKAADDLVEKSGELSKAQAIDRVLQTPEGGRLYSQYMTETVGAVS